MFLFQDRPNRPATFTALALIILMIILYLKPIYDSIGGDTILWIYDIAVVLLAGVGTLLSFLLVRSYSPGEVLRRVWLALGIGLLLWTIGEALWAYYELALGLDLNNLPPSPADISWVIGYIPLFIALYLRYRSLGTTPERERLIPMLILFVVLVAAVAIFIVQPVLVDPELDFYSKVVYSLYPIGDLAVALGVLLIVLVLTGGTLSRPWLIIAIGFLVVSVSDLFYLYTVWHGLYDTEHMTLIPALADILYFVSYVVIALGLYLQARIQKIL